MGEGEGEEVEGEDGEEGSEGEEDDDEEASEGEQDPKVQQKIGPKVTIRKVMQVTTPGGGPRPSRREILAAEDKNALKKRGRPTKADLAIREKDREDAIARGDPDPELKRTRRKPNKLADGASSEEETLLEKKRRKKEEKAGKRSMKKTKSDDTEDTDDDKPKKKKGRARKVLSEDQVKAKEE